MMVGRQHKNANHSPQCHGSIFGHDSIILQLCPSKGSLFVFNVKNIILQCRVNFWIMCGRRDS